MAIIKSMALLLVAAALSACSSPGGKSERQQAFEARLHAIYINQYGDIKQPDTPPGSEEPVPLPEPFDENVYVDNIVKNILAVRAHRPDMKLVVFVHGGLNSSDQVWERANLFTAAMMEENRYPVFVGWNSGGFTNYFDHLLRIRKGEHRPKTGKVTAPLVLAEDIARSLVHVPVAWYTLVADPLTITKTVKAKPERDYQQRMDRLRTAFNIASRKPYDGTGWSSYATIWNPVKFVTAPFIDGLGVGAWDSMLRRTDLILSKSLAFEGPVDGKAPADFADTAVTKLLKKLEAIDNKPPLMVDLIGHSMGAIVVNNILARHPALDVENVVFMGAAAPVKDIENGVVPWLRRQNNKARFFNLSIDPYREIGENYFYDFVPRGSLLNWIDNIFGEVNSFKDRTAGSWWNIVRTAEDVFPVDVRKRVYLTRFGIGGAEMGPQKHGEFDDYYFWRKEFWCAESKLELFDAKKVAVPNISQEGECTPD